MESIKVEGTKARITFFGLCPEVEQVLVEVQSNCKSRLFKETWQGTGNTVHAASPGETLSLADVVERVYHPTTEILKGLSHKVLQNTITLREVDRYFEIYRNHYDVLKEELKIICGDSPVVDERVDQIKDYHIVKVYQSGASLMMQIKQEFNLSGDFSIVEKLLTVVSGFIKSLKLDILTFYTLIF